MSYSLGQSGFVHPPPSTIATSEQTSVLTDVPFWARPWVLPSSKPTISSTPPSSMSMPTTMNVPITHPKAGSQVAPSSMIVDYSIKHSLTQIILTIASYVVGGLVIVRLLKR